MFIGDNEEEAKKFMSMTEFNKEVSGMSYQAKRTPLLQSLYDIWGIDPNFVLEYWCDYTMVKGDEDDRSAWCDKYTTVVFREGDDWKGEPQQRIHRRPLPDYMRWFASGGELHYLPYESRSSLPIGRWDTVTGCYIPSYCLNLAYILMPKRSGSLLQSLALLKKNILMKKKRTLTKKGMTTSNGNSGRNTSCSRKKRTHWLQCAKRGSWKHLA